MSSNIFIISLIISFFINLILLLKTLKDVIKRKSIELVDYFVFSLIFFNGITYFIIIYSSYTLQYQSIYTMWIKKLHGKEWVYTILSFTAALFVRLGANISKFFINKRDTHNKIYDKNKRRLYYINGWVPFIIMVIGIISYFLYAKAYGGFIGLLNYSSYIRSGLFEFVEENPLSFLQRLGGLVVISSFLFAGLLSYEKKKYKMLFDIIGLIISTLFSLYVFYSWLWRAGILSFLISFPFGLIISRHGREPKIIIRYLLIFLIIIVLIMPTITNLLTPGKSYESSYYLFIKELSFPAVAFSACFNAAESRYMKDIIIWPIYFLPKRIWGNLLGVVAPSEYITRVISGSYKGEAYVTGEIPLDFISFGYLEGGGLGVILWSLIFGFILYLIEYRVIKNYFIGSHGIFIYSYTVISIAIMSVLYGDPANIINRAFYLFLGYFFVYIYFRVKYNKHNRFYLSKSNKTIET